jgi:hypothetical protein
MAAATPSKMMQRKEEEKEEEIIIICQPPMSSLQVPVLAQEESRFADADRSMDSLLQSLPRPLPSRFEGHNTYSDTPKPNRRRYSQAGAQDSPLSPLKRRRLFVPESPVGK